MRRTLYNAVLLVTIASASAAQNAPATDREPPRRPGTVVRIDLIGDSTQTDNAGYGRGFCANLTEQVDCLNMSKGGSSTKTFREQRLWEKSLNSKPDYMLIQFGHNDMETPEHLERQVSMIQYEQNLRTYVSEARSHNIKPVLVTPLTRRYFQADGKVHSDLLEHSATMKRVAAEMNVPLIDLQALSIAYLDSIGEAQGLRLGITKKDSEGKTQPDKTHLNWQGSYVFGRMVAVAMGKVVAQLQPFVRTAPALLPPEGLLAMQVIQGASFKIVLVGDSTVAAEGGWGPGFCATTMKNVTCVDLALNGRSSKSFMDEGAWKKALAQKGQYYFIQFGHNDQKADAERHTDADTGYAANLRRYVSDTRAIGGIPILVSSLSRRNYRDGELENDGLREYAMAARRVAAEEKVAFVDLFSLSQQYLKNETQQQADAFNATSHPDVAAENKQPTKPDRTHLNDYGKTFFGRMVADNVIRTEAELGPNINGLPAGATSTTPQQAAPTDGH